MIELDMKLRCKCNNTTKAVALCRHYRGGELFVEKIIPVSAAWMLDHGTNCWTCPACNGGK